MLTNIEMQTLEALRKAAVTYARQSEEKDWEQRRYEIAKEVMPVLAEINERKDKPNLECWVARCAIDYADALIAELKKEVKP